jgi:putative nucleotidyltransferase with HDIG domain
MKENLKTITRPTEEPDVLHNEAKITALKSHIAIVSEMNKLLLDKAKNEQDFFQKVCDMLTKVEYIKLVWVGLIEKNSFKVKPIAQAGFEEGYLSSINVTWDDSEFGKGPTGTAIKTRQPNVMRDIRNDPRYTPWREQATKRGYASSLALPLLYAKETLGALNLYSEKEDAFKDAEIGFLTEITDDVAVGIKVFVLEKKLKQSLLSIQKTLNKTVEAIALICETKDPYIAGHQKRVTKLACAIAKKMNLSNQRIKRIRTAGLLHDIGKISIPTEILSKPGKINEYESKLIESHPQTSYQILKEIELHYRITQAILQHHERIDGSGYPLGLLDKEIILEAKILGVADVVEAMASHRPYRDALGISAGLEEISKNRGILYAAKVVDACLMLFQKEGFCFD